jgi:hypothetical protein
VTPASPTPPAKPEERFTLEDLFFVRNEGDLTAEERALWAPQRVRLVREGWLLSGAIGFTAAGGQALFAILRNSGLTFGVGSAWRLVLWTSCFTALCAIRLVRPRVIEKRDEFVRSKRLRDLIRRGENPRSVDTGAT